MSYTANVYGLHPDKLYSVHQLLGKRRPAKTPPGQMVVRLAQQLYAQRQQPPPVRR